jgi:large subunit ribosomal protein L15
MTNLQGSGLPIVISQALYAIVGAVALQKGGDAANNVTKERILERLGLN